jgi:hypothetical protein
VNKKSLLAEKLTGSFVINPMNSTNLSGEMQPALWQCENYSTGSLFHWDSINPSNPINSVNSIAAVLLLSNELASFSAEGLSSFTLKIRI